MQTVESVKEVKSSGSSYVIYITRELKMLEVKPGDKIKISISKTV